MVQKTSPLTIQTVLNSIRSLYMKKVEEGYIHLYKRINNKL